MLRSSFATTFFTAALALSAQYTATVKTSVSKGDVSGWKKWSNAECVMNYPADWTNEGSLGSDALASFFPAPDSTNRFRERVLLRSRDAGGATLVDLVQRIETETRATLTDARVTGSNVGDGSAVIELTGLIDDIIVNVKQEVNLHNGKVWVLTYLAPRDRYDDKLYLAEAMFMSFAVK